TDERVHVTIAHREHEARHTAHVETQYTQPLGVDEGELPGASDDELEVANLRLEILTIELDDGDVRADERCGRDDETVASQVLGRGGERHRRLVVQSEADDDEREWARERRGVLDGAHRSLDECRVGRRGQRPRERAIRLRETLVNGTAD